jgi:hypothetical protein
MSVGFYQDQLRIWANRHRRRYTDFDPIKHERQSWALANFGELKKLTGRLRELEESRRSLKNWSEGGRRQSGDGQREGRSNDGERSEYHGRQAKIDSIECRPGDESGGCSGLERRRSHKVEGLIGGKLWRDLRLAVPGFPPVEDRISVADFEEHT